MSDYMAPLLTFMVASFPHLLSARCGAGDMRPEVNEAVLDNPSPHTALITEIPLLFFLLRFDLDNLNAPVIATTGAHMMWESQLATLWARHKPDSLQGQMATPTITASLG